VQVRFDVAMGRAFFLLGFDSLLQHVVKNWI